MIIDAHYHFEPKMEPVKRLLDQMRLHKIDRTALIPALSPPFKIGAIPNKLSAMMCKALLHWEKVGLFLYQTTVTEDGQFSMLGKKYPIYGKVDNETTASLLAEYPDKFYGWILVNPKAGVSLDEVERWAEKPGWIGVKAHPFWHRYPIAELDGVAGFCEERNLPLLIHLGGDKESGDYTYLTERHKKLNVVYAHAAIPFFEGVWEYAGKKENVFVDLSSPYLDQRLRRKVLNVLGPEKCLFGSDGPYGPAEYLDADGGYDHGFILNQILRICAGYPAEKIDLVISGNFMGITGLN